MFLNPQKVLAEIDIKKGMKIADFGCGSGNITIPMAKKVEDEGLVYAIDVLETALESIKSRAKMAGLRNIKTIRANLEEERSSGLKDESVDLVLLANILFQSPKQKNIIKEAIRVLKNGGQLVIIDWKSDSSIAPKTPYLTSVEKVKKMVSLTLEKEISAGQYHFGLVFRKK